MWHMLPTPIVVFVTYGVCDKYHNRGSNRLNGLELIFGELQFVKAAIEMEIRRRTTKRNTFFIIVPFLQN